MSMLTSAFQRNHLVDFIQNLDFTLDSIVKIFVHLDQFVNGHRPAFPRPGIVSVPRLGCKAGAIGIQITFCKTVNELFDKLHVGPRLRIGRVIPFNGLLLRIPPCTINLFVDKKSIGRRKIHIGINGRCLLVPFPVMHLVNPGKGPSVDLPGGIRLWKQNHPIGNRKEINPAVAFKLHIKPTFMGQFPFVIVAFKNFLALRNTFNPVAVALGGFPYTFEF